MSCKSENTKLPISPEELDEILTAQTPHIAITKTCSPIADTVTTIAALTDKIDEKGSLHELLDRLAASRETAPRQLVIEALDEAKAILETHHEKITNDEELRGIANKLATCIALTTSDELNITLPTRRQGRAPRPPLTVGTPSNVGSAYNTTIIEGFSVPADLNVVHDLHANHNLSVDNDLTVGGSFIIVGPTTFHGDVFLQPLFPDNDIAVHFNDNLGTELARIYTPSTGPTGGIVISTTGGTTENFRVQGDGNTQITGNLTLTGTGSGNLIMGAAAAIYKPVGTIFMHTTGTNNTFLGAAAGSVAAAGAGNNVGLGSAALTALTTGDNNVAVGRISTDALSTGSNNVAVGYSTLGALTTGSNNVALGYQAGNNYTTETGNIAIGTNVVGSAGESNTIRIGSTAAGTTGNIRIGTSGTHTTAYITGINAVNVGAAGNLVGITTGHQLGTTATDWTLNGNQIITGNLTLGASAIVYKPAGTRFIHTTGTSNTFVGANAGSTALTTADSNVGMGSTALTLITTGDDNVAVGYSALGQLTTGSRNVCVGYQAGNNYNDGEANNICIGNIVTGTATESNTIRVGNATHSTAYITGINAVNVGAAGNLVGITTGHQLGTTATDWTLNGNQIITGNLTLGASAIVYKPAGTRFIHTTGTNNTFVGASAGNLSLTTADSCIGLGGSTLASITTGDDNTALGHLALSALTTGTTNLAAGYSAGLNYNDGETNNICLGANVTGVASESNTIRIGSTLATASPNTIRIGTSGTHTNTYITGINAVNVGATGNLVGITTGHQLGTTATDWTLNGNQIITGNQTVTGNLILGSTSIVYKPAGTKFIHTGVGAGNTFVGSAAGNSATAGATYNTGFGINALNALTGSIGGDNNVAIGGNTLELLTTGSTNTAIGRHALSQLTTGTGHVAIGYQAGYSYTDGETNNICIGTSVTGTATESNVIRIGSTAAGTTGNIRIGTSGTHTNTYITGINAVNVGATGNLVGITTGHQLGTTATDWTLNGNQIITGDQTVTGDLILGSTSIVYKPAGTKFIHTGVGAGNTFVGSAAGNAVLAGATYNTGFGINALNALTGSIGGDNNVAIGGNALEKLTTGSTNTALGRQALNRLLTGTDNVCIGHQAGYNYTTTEYGNICIGTSTSGTTGENDVIRIGSTAAGTTGNIRIGTSGTHTTAYITGINAVNVGATGNLIGITTGHQLGTTATDWTLNGNQILTGNLTLADAAIIYKPAGAKFIHTGSSTNNTFVGEAAGNAVTAAATNNVGIGRNALTNLTGVSGGDNNVAVGYQAGQTYTIESGNICIGTSVTGTAGESNAIRIGSTAAGTTGNIRIGTSGTHTTAYITGINAVNVGATGNLVGITTGHQLGTTATDWTLNGNAILTGDLTLTDAAIIYKPAGAKFIHTGVTHNNTFVGEAAGTAVAAGATYNVGVGYQALTGLTGASGGDNNVAIGGHSMATLATGNRNIAIGRDTLDLLSTGDDNIAVGYQALDALTGTGASGGDDNTAVGYAALGTLTEGNHNIAIGYSALSALDTGSNNVAIGWMAGQNYNAAVSNNIAIGYNVQGNATESNAIRIGDTSTTLNSNTIRIGTNLTHTAAYIQGIRGVNVGITGLAVYINSSGQLGTTTSSARFKENIADLPDKMNLFSQLRPVTFNYIGDDTANVQLGLIAEEVAPLFPGLVVYDDDGITPYAVKYHLLPALLIKELQEAYREIATLKAKVDALMLAHPEITVP